MKPQKPQALKLKIWGRLDNARSLIQETKGPLKKAKMDLWQRVQDQQRLQPP
ncbi:hypothetical protein HanIR_Chr14g0689621 [Helianthus annuus]|nr:hypothetical protein HanIR_Chr14g0689621 [Helianthus annuus]